MNINSINDDDPKLSSSDSNEDSPHSKNEQLLEEDHWSISGKKSQILDADSLSPENEEQLTSQENSEEDSEEDSLEADDSPEQERYKERFPAKRLKRRRYCMFTIFYLSSIAIYASLIYAIVLTWKNDNPLKLSNSLQNYELF